LLIERNDRRQPGGVVKKVEKRFGHVVRLNRASGHVHNGEPGLGAEAPAEVVRQPHASGRVAGHRVNATVSRASPGCDHCKRLRCQPVDPGRELDRLAGPGVVAHRGPVAFFLDVLIGNGTFDHEHEGGIELSLRRVVPDFHVLVAAEGVIQNAIVEMNFGQPRDGAHHDVFDARLRRGGGGDGVAVTPETVRRPQDVNFLDGRFRLRLATVGDCLGFGHGSGLSGRNTTGMSADSRELFS
jgi:hypothetical protein